MPVFSYIALDARGKKERGTMDAATRTLVIDQLAQQGKFVTKIDEEDTEKEKRGFLQELPFLRPVSTNDVVLMNRRLATLIGSDIPLVESLKAITQQLDNAAFKSVLQNVTENVQQGQSLSRALSKYPRVFPELMISMIRVGETGGILGSVLNQLADFMERDKEIKTEVKSALAYPIFVLGLATAIVIFLLTTIVPQLSSLFMGMKMDLPLPTILLIKVSTFFKSYGIYLLLFLAAIAGGIVYMMRTPMGRAFYDQATLTIPITGNLKQKTAIARFTRSLGALVRGGVPLMEALEVVKHILNNALMTEAVDRIQVRVRKGDPMARGMSHEPIFPEMVRYMIAAGEDSGQLDEMLFKVAEIYEMEARNSIKIVISLLSPFLILIVAGIVGFIAMAMLLPIFELNKMFGS